MARGMMLVLGLLAAAPLALGLGLDMGEVVQLRTRGETGETHEIPLWITDVDGREYLRASHPRAAWAEQLRAQPLTVLVRSEGAVRYRALEVADATLRRAVAAEARAKYGLADALFGLTRNDERAAVFELTRLELLQPSADAARH